MNCNNNLISTKTFVTMTKARWKEPSFCSLSVVNMSDLELYQLPEDIRNEFRVDAEGRVFAKSVRAIARLCGCSDSSIHEIITKLALGVDCGKAFKPFLGMDFRALGGEYNHLFVCACVEHFAHYAQKTNDTALKNYRFLANYGYLAGLQKLLGWQDPTQQNNLTNQKLDMLMQYVANLTVSQAALEAKMNSIVGIKAELPGIKIVLEFPTNLLPFRNMLPNKFDVRTWVRIMKGINLDRGQCSSFGRHMVDNFVTFKQEDPERLGTKCMYTAEHSSILEAAWKGWIVKHPKVLQQTI